MLDCLKPGGGSNSNTLASSKKSSSTGDLGNGENGGVSAGTASRNLTGSMSEHGVDGVGGEVVVLHYYHQYLLKVAVLETMHRCVRVCVYTGVVAHRYYLGKIHANIE